MSANVATRRGFITGAAVTTAAISAAARASFAAEVVERPAWLPEAWDYEAEVVVCGFGGAGAMGSREAVANGCSVIALEAAPYERAGGSTACCAGVCSPASGPEFYIESSMGYIQPDTAELLTEETARVVDWMMADGLVFNGMLAAGFGYGLYQAERGSVEKCGPTVLYETPVEHLIADPVTKEVYGVQARDAQGNPVYVKATRGVLISTGNFAANEELIHNYMLPREIDYAQNGSPYDTGAGLIMGLEIGAATMNMNLFTLELTDMDLKIASKEVGIGLDVSPAGENAWAMMYVNQKAQRFMNEDQVLDHYKGVMPWLHFGGTAAYGYTGWENLPCYVVFDSKIADTTPLNTASGYGMAGAGAFGYYRWSQDNQAEVEAGWLAKADTLEGLVALLAEQSGREPLDAEVLAQTIADYNNLCAANQADAFGRTSWVPIDTPPYYAAELITGCVYSMGGLKPGPRCETLDLAGNPIPRLYHGGDVGQYNAITSQGTAGAMACGAIGVREICSFEARDIPGEAAVVVAPPTAEQVAFAQYVEGGAALAAGMGQMADGTYTAMAQGKNGLFEVRVTIADRQIVAVEFGENSETEGMGAAALEVLPDMIIEANGTNVDAILGATTTASAVLAAVNDCISQASAWSAGTGLE